MSASSTSSSFSALLLAVILASRLFAFTDVIAPKGIKTTVAFWTCTHALWCHLDMCIEIKTSDGKPARAHLFSDWTPGKYHDLDVHEGKYCDKLDAYIFMSYSLYAIAETEDVRVTVGSEVAP